MDASAEDIPPPGPGPELDPDALAASLGAVTDNAQALAAQQPVEAAASPTEAIPAQAQAAAPVVAPVGTPVPQASPQAQPGAPQAQAPAPEAPPLITIGPPPEPPAEDRSNPEASAQAMADYRAKLYSYDQKLRAASAAVQDKSNRDQLAVAQRQVSEGLRYANERHADLDAEAKARAQDSAQLQEAVSARKQAMERGRRSYWDDTSTGEKIGAAFLVALGGLGAAMQDAAAARLGQVGHASNQGLTSLMRNIDMDYRRKQDAIRNASDYEVELRTGNRDAQAARHELLTEHAQDHMAKLAMLGDEAALAQKKAQTDAQRVAAQQTQSALANDYTKTAAASLEKAIDNRQQAKDAALRRMELQENLQFHRDELNLRAGEAAARDKEAAERAATKGEERKEKEDSTIVRDEHNKAYARVTSGRGGVLGFAEKDSNLDKAITSLKALLADVDANGERVVDPAKVKARISKYGNALGAVVTSSPMGTTVESQHVEKSTLGASGAPDLEDPTAVVVGANREAIARKLDEAIEMRARNRREALTPLSPEEAERYNSKPLPEQMKGDRAPEAPAPKAKAAPGKPQAAGKPAQAKIDLAWRALDDKEATARDRQQATKILSDAGLL